MNKYTNMIDSLFSKYGKPSDKYIFLGACKQGINKGFAMVREGADV